MTGGRSSDWCGLAVLSFTLAGQTVWAAAPPADPERSAARFMTPATEKSIQKGLAWLAAQQHEADGSFGAGTYVGNTAVTGLAGMAMMASGSTPDQGPYGRNVARCADYLLANAQQSGFISVPRGAGHGPMYGHGFATLFLAECYGMSGRTELRDTLSKAVQLIVNAQNKEGGWRYLPQRADADISVTVTQLMALRAARNAGIAVPKETVQRALDYILRCQNADGGFRYRLEGDDRESGYPRSAAAVAALNSAGVYEGPAVQKGIDYLLGALPRPGAVIRGDAYYDYGHYYAAQALWQAGGDAWARWYPAMRDDILSRQRDDGAWPSHVSVEASTAMYLMALCVPYNYLPIFQR